MAKPKGTNATIGGGGFHHVAVRAKDFQASLKFYCEGLGFVEKLRWGEDDKTIALLDTGDGSYIELFATYKGPMPEGAWAHVAFRTDNVELAIERARAAGAEVTMEPRTIDIDSRPIKTTLRVAFCKGPDGEIIEFFQNDDT
jgi:glyoxylase I family protein